TTLRSLASEIQARLTRKAIGRKSVICTPYDGAQLYGDKGRSFEFDNQVLISSRRKLLWSKAKALNVAEKSAHDPVRQRSREASVKRVSSSAGHTELESLSAH